MDGTMAEIRWFAPNFAPRNWALCQGQLLALNQNQALFALLGTVYGGDGRTTFALPNFAGRAPVGAQGGYVAGQIGGVNNYTLQAADIPLHTHTSTVTKGTGKGTGTITISATNTAGTLTTPAGNILAADDGNGAADVYAPANSPIVAMAALSIVVTVTAAPAATPPAVTVAPVGANTPHNNMMPSLALNTIICTMGIFPSRS